MKNKSFFTLLIAVSCMSVLALTGCGGSNTAIYAETAITNNFVNYEAKGSAYSYNDLQKTIKYPTMQNSGDLKMLVIPIAVKGYEANKTDKVKNDITKVFCGKAEETSWQSVNSFYKASSYGKLNLIPTVSDWYDCGLTTDQILAKAAKKEGWGDDGGTWYLLEEAFKWYKTKYSTTGTEFDNDKDGYIDCVYMVYNAPYYTEENKLSNTFWAFQFYDANNLFKPNVDNPVVCRYAWASSNFIYDDYGDNACGVNTFTHEMGHILGVPDYYDTAKTPVSERKSPYGGIDMMDQTLADHNPYSKFAYQWIKPYVVTGTANISIRSFVETGDCILLSPKFTKSAFEEYILIELYTPTGLNEKHATTKIGGINSYSIPGIRITHVNAEMVQYNASGKPDKFVTEINPDLRTEVNAGNSHLETVYPVLNMIERDGSASGLNKFVKFDNTALFQSHDVFDLDRFSKNFKNGKLVNDNTLPFSVEIGTVTKSFANIGITFLG